MREARIFFPGRDRVNACFVGNYLKRWALRTGMGKKIPLAEGEPEGKRFGRNRSSWECVVCVDGVKEKLVGYCLRVNTM